MHVMVCEAKRFCSLNAKGIEISSINQEGCGVFLLRDWDLSRRRCAFGAPNTLSLSYILCEERLGGLLKNYSRVAA